MHLVEAAGEEFLNKGYDGASMAGIAKKADVAKNTVYWYFKNKDELFASVLTAQQEESFKDLAILETHSKQYHGNKKSKVYHSSTCKFLPYASSKKSFSSIKEATTAGYKPCGLRNPQH